jgi:hypothetical protein
MDAFACGVFAIVPQSRQQPFGGAMGGLELGDVGIVAVICPTCQNVFAD